MWLELTEDSVETPAALQGREKTVKEKNRNKCKDAVHQNQVKPSSRIKWLVEIRSALLFGFSSSSGQAASLIVSFSQASAFQDHAEQLMAMAHLVELLGQNMSKPKRWNEDVHVPIVGVRIVKGSSLFPIIVAGMVNITIHLTNPGKYHLYVSILLAKLQFFKTSCRWPWHFSLVDEANTKRIERPLVGIATAMYQPVGDSSTHGCLGREDQSHRSAESLYSALLIDFSFFMFFCTFLYSLKGMMLVEGQLSATLSPRQLARLAVGFAKTQNTKLWQCLTREAGSKAKRNEEKMLDATFLKYGMWSFEK